MKPAIKHTSIVLAGLSAMGALAIFMAGPILPVSAAASDKAAATRDGANTGSALAPRVSVAKARQRQVIESVTVTGTLVPRDEVFAGAEIDGLRIIEILAEEGQKVKKGQVLVRLARDTLDAQVAQSDAALARSDAAIAQAKSQIIAAEVSVKFSTADLERAQTLIKRGVSTQAIIDQKTSVANTAKAQLQVAKDTLRASMADRKNIEAQRRELMVRVGRSEIKAPAAGLIANRNAKLGAMVSAAGQPLFKIIKDSKVELDGEVTEQHLLSIQTGQAAKVILANGAEVSGKVRLISPQIDPVSRLGHIRVELDDNTIARSGAFARALVEVRRSQSVTVPASAVLYENRTARVQIADGAVVRARQVKLGLVAGEYAEILDGVKPGELVVQRAGAFLRDGDLITPVAVVPAKQETN